MSKFNIEASDLIWICDNPDDPEDLCLHGHVKAEIGENVLEDDGTVSATALYLLKTLTEDKLMAPHDIQMIPCCGHFMIANDDLTNVTILGCDYGTDWSTIHTARGVKIILPTGEETVIPLEEYKAAVFAFVDSIEAFYQSCTPKKIPSDENSKYLRLKSRLKARGKYVSVAANHDFGTRENVARRSLFFIINKSFK